VEEDSVLELVQGSKSSKIVSFIGNGQSSRKSSHCGVNKM